MKTLIAKAAAISELKKIIDQIPHDAADKDDIRFVHWSNEAKGVVAMVFGDDSSPVKEFSSIRWFSKVVRITAGGGNDQATESRHRMNLKTMQQGFAAAQGQLKSLLKRIDLLPDDPTTNTDIPTKTDRVFIVHGHDDGLKNAVARYISALDLTPVILHEQPDMGRTLIEKFEQESECAFAVVLATGDDLAASVRELAKKAGDTEDTLKARARQNVIFELGYFVGKIGRGGAMLITESSVELPSDMAGIIYSTKADWFNKLWNELDAAGFSFNSNQIKRATAIRT